MRRPRCRGATAGKYRTFEARKPYTGYGPWRRRVAVSLRHPFGLTSVSESRAEALRLCEKKLAPLGVTVRPCGPGGALPYADASFDLVLNGGAPYAADEVRRVLKPGGYFITEQAGGSDGLRLRAHARRRK